MLTMKKAPAYTTLSIKKLFKGEDLESLTIEQLQEKTY